MSASSKVKSKNKKGLLVVLVVIAIIIAIVTIHTITKLTYNKVYEGVYIGETSVAGMSRQELEENLPSMVDFSKQMDLTICVEDVREVINARWISPAVDVEKMIDAVMLPGRQTSGLSRLKEISALKKNPTTVPYILCFDEQALQRVLNRISSSLNITAVDNEIKVGEDSLVITHGKAGLGIDYNEFKAAISNSLIQGNSTVSVELKQITPEEITVEYIKRHTSRKPVEATYSITDHRMVITQSMPGVTLDEKDVQRQLEAEKGSNQITIPAKVKQPEVTTEYLQSTLLCDELGTFSSNYSSSSADRAYNIQLASEHINGYVLAPGEEFSYNDVVGPRTQERGFRMANVYVGNTVQPGIGGGICQVSSTLFNAVVFADLEVTERRNHTLPVSYVPMGRDATVSYGTVDFKFKNNYENPIEIRIENSGRINKVSIYGTNERPNREIKIETENTGTSSPKVVRKDDNTLAEGVVKVESPGTNGSSYIAYKIVYENGKEISRDVLCRSTYRGKDRVELIGTKKVEAETPPPEDTSETESSAPASHTIPDVPSPAPETGEPLPIESEPAIQ